MLSSSMFIAYFLKPTSEASDPWVGVRAHMHCTRALSTVLHLVRSSTFRHQEVREAQPSLFFIIWIWFCNSLRQQRT